MKLFPFGHATHPRWEMAAGLVLAQVRAQMTQARYASSATLGLLYITDHYAEHAKDILDHFTAELREVADWGGTVGVGVSSSGVEYFDEPAISLMLCDLPPDQFRVFSGVSPLSTGEGMGFEPFTALVHADAQTPDVAELLAELAGRTTTGYLFGGLASSRGDAVQFAVSGNGTIRGQGLATGVFRGGLSGVAFGADVALVSRVTQGCRPIAPQRAITACDNNVIVELDGRPALDVLLEDLAVTLDEPETAIAKLRQTLVGLTEPGSDVVRRTGHFGPDVMVRHIIGLDPGRRAFAIADRVAEGMHMAFCERNAEAARADLMRICAEIREELEPEEVSASVAQSLADAGADAAPMPERRIAGAVYVSCAGRGGPHFGAPSAELQIVKRILGDVPLVGFFAGGEIARHHLYGYTGVLTVFRTNE